MENTSRRLLPPEWIATAASLRRSQPVVVDGRREVINTAIISCRANTPQRPNGRIRRLKIHIYDISTQKNKKKV
jgi:hypothetical protein